ncbi:MAG: plasmid pRiA4b ORF-3 family protein [Deferrisomatales bacterium]|nr:plasmid pRiA4b ORF-3 family protein [Deferrisomatales bacterium]
MPPKNRPAKPLAPVRQLKVTLKGSRPPIWRRVLVAGDTRLSRLHEFHVGRGVRIGRRDPEWGAPGEVMDERRVALSSLAPEVKDKFTYLYDFGDGWEHTILVEKILAPAPATALPTCVAGKRACPPEDCGGVWGYAELLEVPADPGHPERV